MYKYCNYSVIGISAPFLPLIGQQRHVSQTVLGLMFCLFALGGGCISLIAGKMMLSFGRKNTLILSSSLYIAGMVMIMLV